jgi:hypothetical protein
MDNGRIFNTPKPADTDAMLRDLMSEARGFISDCTDEMSDVIADTTAMILVHRNFEGGWAGFIASDMTLDEMLVHNAIISKYGAQFAATIYRA